LRAASARTLAYPEVSGSLELRSALAAYLRRARGVVTGPESIVICSGATQGIALLSRALARLGRSAIAIEDPCLPPHRAALQYAGLEVQSVPVDGEGLLVEALNAPIVLTTPAHQFPTGVALSPARRSALMAWASAGGLVIEDDYDAEFRYDRAPIGALQGLAPERVVYLGTTSKTIAPGLRLGWLVLPQELIAAVLEAKLLDDLGCATLEQLVLARLIESAAYDRELRRARRRNRARRDALLAAVTRRLPHARTSGIAAGLHALLHLPEPVDARRLLAAASARGVGVYPLSFHLSERRPDTEALVMGYASLSEAAIEEGVRVLAEILKDLCGGGRR
jgi:GntR family transcriptional regulator / MocR family aminotransferase